MPPADLRDYRRASEAELVRALAGRNPLALAEAYHRTAPAAHACARRLLASSSLVEALLCDLYGQLWESPPQGGSLGARVRACCFELATAVLSERQAAPASPSLTALLPQLPEPQVRYPDAAERVLADLPETHRRAVLLAHDRGLASQQQEDPDAGEHLSAALLALAGPEQAAAEQDACADIPDLADWVLGLLDPRRADDVAAAVARRPECEARVAALRRGRRRLEGLPPTPDMGQRVLVVVLSASAAAPVEPAGAVASAAVDGLGLRSALDESAPFASAAPAQVEPAPEVEDAAEDALEQPAEDHEAPPPAASDDERDSDERTQEYEPLSPVESRVEPDPALPFAGGGRVLGWLLSAMFVVVGIALGLYLGVEVFSRL